ASGSRAITRSHRACWGISSASSRNTSSARRRWCGSCARRRARRRDDRPARAGAREWLCYTVGARAPGPAAGAFPMIGQLDQARTGTGQVQDAVEHELKFTVPVSSTAAVLAWLRGACTPDPKFPCGRVSRIYNDTPDPRSLREKLNSDYLKTKVRLRWYATLDGE